MNRNSSTKSIVKYGRRKFRKKLTEHGYTRRAIRDAQKEMYRRKARKKLAVVELKEKFPKILKELERRIEFCKVKKCRIETKKGGIVVKKRAIVPQELQEETKRHIVNLKNRRIIRNSDLS